MKRALPILALLVLLSFAFDSIGLQAQTIEQSDNSVIEDEDDAPVARVARLSFIEGDVSFLRAGVTEWAEAVENLPLLAGDQIYTGAGARAEIQLARGSYIRLSENTALTITTLSDEAAQFEITEGIAIIRVERFATAFKRFEVDTPNSALLLQEDGLYRVNVRGNEDSEVLVRRGSAEVSTDDGSFRVREGHKLIVDTSSNGKLEIALDTSGDSWDQWSYQRDSAIDQTYASASPDYVTTYETNYNSFYGVSDLGNYGSWFNHSDYGYCWRPRANYDWTPYRDGQWLWVPRVGWTWLSHERWGWAPYHYGRWVFISNYGWSWVPGISIGRSYRSPWYYSNPYRYYRWRPALVYFYNCQTPRGNYVAWHPLAPHERWRNPDRYRRNDHSHLRYPAPRDGGRRPDDDRLRARLPRDGRGVSMIPVDGFTRPDRGRVRPVAPGREDSEWIGRNARAGLPEITPAPIATAPALRDLSNRANRRIAIPPAEIIKRPVVTRNRAEETQAGISVPVRQRKLIMPRAPVSLEGSNEQRARRLERREERRAKNPVSTPGNQQGSDDSTLRIPRKERMQIPAPVEKGRDRENSSGRVRDTVGDVVTKPNDNSQNQNGETRRERRLRQREEIQTPGGNSPSIERPSVERPREDDSRRERVRPRIEIPNESQREETRSREERRRERQERQQQENQSSNWRNNNEQSHRQSQPRVERSQSQPESRAERREERRQERENRRKP